MSVVRTATAVAPPTVASTPDFLSLGRLDELPELAPFLEVCDRVSAQITALDLAIPRAIERVSVMWRAHQNVTIISGTNQEEAPDVSQARAEVAALQAQRKTLAAQAVVARSELESAAAQLKAELMPAMAAQLAPPLSTLIRALEATLAIERLCGNVGGHVQARAIVGVMLPYLKTVRAVLGEEG